MTQGRDIGGEGPAIIQVGQLGSYGRCRTDATEEVVRSGSFQHWNISQSNAAQEGIDGNEEAAWTLSFALTYLLLVSIFYFHRPLSCGSLRKVTEAARGHKGCSLSHEGEAHLPSSPLRGQHPVLPAPLHSRFLILGNHDVVFS